MNVPSDEQETMRNLRPKSVYNVAYAQSLQKHWKMYTTLLMHSHYKYAIAHVA